MQESAADRKARLAREAARYDELRLIDTGRSRWGEGQVHLGLYDGDAWRAVCRSTQQPADAARPAVSLEAAFVDVTCQKCRLHLTRLAEGAWPGPPPGP